MSVFIIGAILSGIAYHIWGTSAKEKTEQQPRPQRQPRRRRRRPERNTHYTSLRAQAKEARAQMELCFEGSDAARADGDLARAKELRNEGKERQREIEELNAQASEWIFTENNKGREPGEVDLHGLFVKEAIAYTNRAIRDARKRGDTKLCFIVGKGLHSTDGVPKLKPAIEELMQKNGLVTEVDYINEGVLIVNLDGRPSGEGHSHCVKRQITQSGNKLRVGRFLRHCKHISRKFHTS